MADSDLSQPHEIEPELRQPSPRRLSRRPFLKTPGGCLLGLMPWILPGFFVLGMAIGKGLDAFCGQAVPGEVTQGTSWMSKSGGTDSPVCYAMTYRYHIDGHDYSGTDCMRSNSYQRGMPVQVKALPWAPTWQATLMTDDEDQNPAILYVFPVVWFSIVGVFVWGAVVLPSREASLLTRGTAAVATVTDRVASSQPTGAPALVYEFKPAGVGPGGMGIVRSRHSVPTGDTTPVGQRLTVLYDPARPQRNLLYRFSTLKLETDDTGET